jgi:hypothetical protein
MRIDSRRRLVLVLVVVAALLALALAGPVQRHLERRDREARQREAAELVARERATAAEHFLRDRERIMADLRERLARQDYVGVLKASAPYGGVADEEFRALYREAAQAQSRVVRGDQYAAVVARDCDEPGARAAVRRVLGAVGTGASFPPDAPSHVERVGADEARRIVLSRLREPPPVDHAHARPSAGAPAAPAPAGDWITRMRDEHRGRILPDYLGFLHSPRGDEVVCVWRASGDRTEDGRALRYVLDLWLVPSPDLKGTTADVAAYSERPR